MKTFKKMYLEITNVCNLSCSFCPPTTRPPRTMTVAEFTEIAEKIRPHGRFLYLHIKGEPTMHPQLSDILAECHRLQFRVCITTNGTLLGRMGHILLDAPAVHKVHISLHSFEANDLPLSLDDYLDSIVDFIRQSTAITVLRLWNQGGEDGLNQKILDKLHSSFSFLREDKITDHAFLESGQKFQWADLSAPQQSEQGFCYALRDQIGILVDGTVVPCCLDNNGDIPLGNIRQLSLQEIYDSPRAKGLYDGFSRRQFSEKLCKSCGFVGRFG